MRCTFTIRHLCKWYGVDSKIQISKFQPSKSWESMETPPPMSALQWLSEGRIQPLKCWMEPVCSQWQVLFGNSAFEAKFMKSSSSHAPAAAAAAAHANWVTRLLQHLVCVCTWKQHVAPAKPGWFYSGLEKKLCPWQPPPPPPSHPLTPLPSLHFTPATTCSHQSVCCTSNHSSWSLWDQAD